MAVAPPYSGVRTAVPESSGAHHSSARIGSGSQGREWLRHAANAHNNCRVPPHGSRRGWDVAGARDERPSSLLRAHGSLVDILGTGRRPHEGSSSVRAVAGPCAHVELVEIGVIKPTCLVMISHLLHQIVARQFLRASVWIGSVSLQTKRE
eukprot:1975279-Prymnesium_polylepis.1